MIDNITDKLRSFRINRMYKRYHDLRNKKMDKIKDKLSRIRKVKLQRRLMNRLLISSQAIGRSHRGGGAGNFIITSPEVAKYLNTEWIKDKILGTQSIENE